jgi:hypothetical protein
MLFTNNEHLLTRFELNHERFVVLLVGVFATVAAFHGKHLLRKKIFHDMAFGKNDLC